MLKLANILKSRGNVSGQSMIRNNNAQNVFMGCASFSTVGQIGQKASTSDRIYAAFMLYKGKAALAAEPVAPTFSENNAGALFIKRSGFIMLSFSPSSGERKYDWERKQRFALSPTEVGTLISMAPTSSCDFFHDPGLKTSDAGQVRKSLKVSATPDGSSYFFTLSVADNIKKINERFTVQVTPGEFSVMRTSFSFALPHIMGWDRYSSKLQPSLKGENYAKSSPNYTKSSLNYTKSGQNNAKSGQKPLDSEWDR